MKLSTTPKHWKNADRFPVIINYQRGLDGMIEDGHYQDVDTAIKTDLSHIRGIGEVTVETTITRFGFEFTQDERFTSVPTETMFIEFDKYSLRPANLEEILAFRKRYPWMFDGAFDLTVLGSHLKNGHRCGISIQSYGSGKNHVCELSLNKNLKVEWSDICRFLVVPLTFPNSVK